ncbi:MAG: ABC transporter permease subunit [Planctomycetota bacterium]|nr:MAG: ABC transporter permease subunit [Planctomycetota bacterium]
MSSRVRAPVRLWRHRRIGEGTEAAARLTGEGRWMELIWEGLREAVRMMAQRDPLVMDAAWRSLWVSSTAVGLATAAGLPIGTLLAGRGGMAARAVIVAMRTAMAVPTVFVGVVCFALFSRRGPLGGLELLYTPWAIVAGEFLLAWPIVVAISHGAVASLDPRVEETARVLGAGPLRRWLTQLSEARTGVALAVLTAFARCVTELGIAVIVGGNIKYRTRTLSTATALETSRGDFGRALAMGVILLAIALAAAVTIGRLSRSRSG